MYLWIVDSLTRDPDKNIEQATLEVDVQKYDIRNFRSLVSGGFSFQGNFDRPTHFRRPILSEYFIDKVVEISEILKAKRINGERDREN